MATKGMACKRMAATTLAVFTMTVALGCAPGSPLEGNVAGPPPEQAPTADLAATPEPTAIAPTAVSSPTAMPTPTLDPESRTIRKALDNLFANLEWFQGIATVSVDPDTPKATSTNLRQWFREPLLMKLEVVRGGANSSPAGSAFVFDGQSVSYFDPVLNQLLELQSSAQLLVFLYLPQDRLLPTLQLFQAPRFLARLSELGVVIIEGSTKVANRGTTVVSITPSRQTPRYAKIRLWLDERTQGLLKAEALNEDGSVSVRIEYQQFELLNEVKADAFRYSPPSQVSVVSPKPQELAELLDYRAIELPDLQARAEFPVLQPDDPPAGVSLQSVRLGSLRGAPVAAFLYGDSPENISTLLIEKPANLQTPVLRNAEPTEINGVAADIYEGGGTVIIDWVTGNTGLTVATSLPRNEALELAKSVR